MDEATPQTPATRLARIHMQISDSARIAQRSPDDICLIAVSKTRTPSEIESLIHAGQHIFGENRVQEATAKWPALKERHQGIALHLIGQLQSNKAGEAVALFDYIHSVDRLSLVSALGKAMDEQQRRVRCFIQVNIGAEEQKGGCAIEELQDLLAAAKGQDIPIAGLMCLPPANLEPAPFFALLAELAARHALPGLSMGMSDDFTTAIMLGASHVRIGTALFGKRSAVA
jgi:PLP dependent protein